MQMYSSSGWTQYRLPGGVLSYQHQTLDLGFLSSSCLAYHIGSLCASPAVFSALQAWRPSVNRGVLFATVAQNGQQWSDGTPFFYGTAVRGGSDMKMEWQ